MGNFALGAALMICSGTLHAIVNAVIKGGRDKAAARAVSDGSSALIVLPLLPFLNFPDEAWIYVLASAALHACYLYALVRAYRDSDFSASYPVLRGTAPLLTALITIGFFGDSLPARQMFGIVAVGFALIAMVAGRHLDRNSLGWALLTGALIAGCTVIDSRGVAAAPSPITYIAWLFLCVGITVVSMFALLSRGAVFTAARMQWRPSVLAGAMSVLGYGMALYALSLGKAAPLAALRETSMISAIVIAVVFLGERVTLGRIVGVVGITLGTMLILTG